ncbi:hypothetical protein ALC62_13572 [Cyphomyrmex costatus]|uniref:Uncharacterized protein n=1 Tax=Cyphomyrmex costatus TaxID=456900 RepID=A0A151IA39_9HYME|nr:hypothetical protein ALC62_13572 [Cyphomyrmex costatus]
MGNGSLHTGCEILYNAVRTCVVCACTSPHVRTYQVPVICSVAEEVQACPQFIGRHPPDTPSAATAAAASLNGSGRRYSTEGERAHTELKPYECVQVNARIISITRLYRVL